MPNTIGEPRALLVNCIAPASGDTFVLGRSDSLDFTITGPASGFALYVLRASQHGRVDTYVTPTDTARLHAVVIFRKYLSVVVVVIREEPKACG